MVFGGESKITQRSFFALRPAARLVRQRGILRLIIPPRTYQKLRSCKLKSMANCRSCGVEVGQGFTTGAVPEYCANCAPPQPSKAGNTIELVRRFPVTYSIMAACIAVYIAMSVSSGTFVAPTVANVLRWGGTGPEIILQGEWWRLVTAVFVHIGIIHIASNMYVFWGLGMMAERLLGRMNFLAVYLLTGIAGNVLTLFLKPNIVGAGASGAIFARRHLDLSVAVRQAFCAARASGATQERSSEAGVVQPRYRCRHTRHQQYRAPRRADL